MEKEYNTPQEEASYYKEAYEQEKARSASLAGRLADARNEADTLQSDDALGTAQLSQAP